MAARRRQRSPFAESAIAAAAAPVGDARDDVEERVRTRLRLLREERGLTLAEVAHAAGMATSTLSRLETGARRLTLAHLPPLARALGIAADELIAPPAPAAARPRSAWTREGVTFEPLTPAPGGGASVCRIHLPASRRDPAPRTHEGRERLHVLDGRLRLVLGEHERILVPGESVEFSTWLPHWSGVVEEPVALLAIFDPLTARG